MNHLIDFILHIDKHLDAITTQYGGWTYLVLFLIVFCETGLVVTPFLPGDSLLFAAGAIAGRGILDVHAIALLLAVAAIVGDAVNYRIGRVLGAKGMERYPRIFRKQHIERTRRYFEKYGGKTIIIARFVPIVRTFAPFLAGVGEMSYLRFLGFNVIGGLAWVVLFTYGGYYFGELPVVKKNFTLVILGIIVVSFLPIVFEYLRARKESKAQAVSG